MGYNVIDSASPSANGPSSSSISNSTTSRFHYVPPIEPNGLHPKLSGLIPDLTHTTTNSLPPSQIPTETTNAYPPEEPKW